MQIFEFLNSGCILSSRGGEVWVGWGKAVRASSPAVEGFSVYAPDFFLQDKTPWWCFPQGCQLSCLVLQRTLDELWLDPKNEKEVQSCLMSLSELNWISPDFDHFQSVFQQLKSQFQLKSLRKAVPVVFEKTKTEVSLWMKAYFLNQLLIYSKNVSVLQRRETDQSRFPILGIQAEVYLYGVWDGSEGLLGATPEPLFWQDQQGRIHTVALAGTRIKNSFQRPLFEDPKEREEHQIVIEGLCSSLASLRASLGASLEDSLGKVQIGKTQELHLPTLSHLVTPLQLELQLSEIPTHGGLFFEEIVKQLHPTPALGAFPKEAGMNWLKNYQEKVERQRFGAPFGAVLGQLEKICCVSIRNLQWNRLGVTLGAGCGIVPASELDREWKEIQAKIVSVKKIFGIEKLQ